MDGTLAADNARQLADAIHACFSWVKENAVAYDDRK
jgi:hypothetical protein